MKKFAAIPLLLLLSVPAWSQQAATAGPSSEAQARAELQAIQAELGADKRVLIENQLALTEEQAKKFWPVYDSHQQGLAVLNQRRLDNVMAYARAFNAGTLDDDSAIKLVDQALDIEKDEVKLLEGTYHKLKGPLPGIKVARYLQLESKIRAIVRFDQAAQVPIIPAP